ncbi:MAG: DNA polymerase domain-containing protein [Candidatus Thorarchaeota archaeon]|nr:DNA polymerase domain-containing protein [Candidatus Thorarchaeota archaeon]
MRYLVGYRYNRDTDNPIYNFLNEETQTLENIVIPRSDSASYFLQGNIRLADIHTAIGVDGITKIIDEKPVQKYNLATNQKEWFWKISMKSAMDVRDYRLETCHEGHIRRITRHALDKKWYMGMPYNENNQLIKTKINVDKKVIDILAKDYPRDVIDYMLDRMFARLPHISKMSLDIETETHGRVRPDPAYPLTPIISAAFDYDIINNEGQRPGIVLMLSSELRNPSSRLHSPAFNEMLLNGKIILELFNSEYEMIRRIFELIEEPHIPLIATYYGEGFDLPYLYNRALLLRFNTSHIPINAYKKKSKGGSKSFAIQSDWVCSIKDKMHIDLYQFFAQPVVKNYVFKGDYQKIGLEDVAQALLGEGKIPHEETFNDMSFGRLGYYNYIDAKLTLDFLRFDDELVLKVIFMFMRLGRQDFYEAAHRAIGHKILNFIQGYLTENDILIPNKTDLERLGRVHSQADISGKRYRGAIVIDYVKGIHLDTSLVDFGSLYPSVMKEQNISFDTINCGHEECKSNLVPGLPHYTCTKRIGVLPLLIGCLKDIRLNIFKPAKKDKRLSVAEKKTYSAIEQAIKVFVNASYGVFAHEGFGLFCLPVAETITAWARDAITQLAIKAEGMKGNDLTWIAEHYGETNILDAIVHIPKEERVVIGGDTDSCHLRGLTKEQIDELIIFSNDVLKLSLELEYISKISLFYKKKNYILIPEYATKVSQIVVKGMTGKKRNTPPIIRTCFDDAKEILLKAKLGEIKIDDIRHHIVSLVRLYYDKIWNHEGKVEDYVFEMQMTKPISQYTANQPQHVRAAKKLARYLRTQSITLQAVSDDILVPANSYVQFIKGSLILGALKYKKGKQATGLKAEPIPVELATINDVTPIFYHDSLVSSMKQVMDALGIDDSEVRTADPAQSTLEAYF